MELCLDRDETVVFRDAKKPETFDTVQLYTLGIFSDCLEIPI